jgi:hypothetical protein
LEVLGLVVVLVVMAEAPAWPENKKAAMRARPYAK